LTTTYVEQLQETILRITAERDSALTRAEKTEQKNLSLEKENQELKARLLFYQNPHTPSSARKLTSPKKKLETKGTSSPKKRGAPKGHKGATRPTPSPTETTNVIADECEKCGSPNVEPLKQIKKSIIEDLPPPQEIKVTQYNRRQVRCLDCGHKFVSKHRDCPQKGNFGIYLIVYITMLKFHLRGVLRKIQDFLKYSNNFDISVKGIHDVLLRVGAVCKTGYAETREKIRKAPWVYIDETGMKVNGENWWLWIFRTPDDDILVVIRKSRGKKVVEKVLGTDWNKPIIVDGWRVYWNYPVVQRCWAHLLREVKAYKKVSARGRQLSIDIHELFKKMRAFLDNNPSISDRKTQKKIFESEMEDLVEKYSKFKKIQKPLTYIKNGLGKWYTCLLYPGMEPTNNLGEQAIREHVIMRKIIGCFRSESGAENYQYIASLLASWKLQEKNVFEELEGILRKELCFS